MATAKVKSLKIAKQANTTRTYFASWEFDNKGSTKGMKKHVSEYSYKWYYYTNDTIVSKGKSRSVTTLATKKWFEGSSGTTRQLKCTYDPPNNAEAIRVSVVPVPKTHKVKKKGKDTTVEKKYFTGKTKTSTDVRIAVVPDSQTVNTKPSTPSAPTCTVSGTQLTAALDSISDVNTKKVYFYIVKNDTSQVSTPNSNVTYGRAAVTYTIVTGSNYKVRCRSYNTTTNEWSEYGAYSSSVQTVPKNPGNISNCTIISRTELQITWGKSDGADSYTVEYATSKSYFDTSSEVRSLSVNSTTATLTGLTSGTKYYIRVKAVNNQGSSGWTSIYEAVVGTVPSAPTTWSELDSVTVGDTIRLFWVHNSEDGSAESGAHLSINVTNSEDVSIYSTVITTTASGDGEISNHEIDTSSSEYASLSSGGKFKWKVQTKGALPDYGPYSTERTIDVYEKPTIDSGVYLTPDKSGGVITQVTTFPFYLIADVAPTTQHVISYSIEVIAKQSYDPINAVGQRVHVSEDDVIFSNQQYYSADEETNTIVFEFNANNVDLEPGQEYIIRQKASMDSGLLAEADYEIAVNWADLNYYPDISDIEWDEDNLTVRMQPFCIILELDEEEDPDAPAVDPGDGEDDFDDDNDDGYVVSPENLATNVTLSVYRIDYDGRFVPIETDIENNLGTVIVDKFPPLDEVSYRIVARDNTTGAISYNDVGPVITGEPSIVIQWNIGEFGQANVSTFDESPDGETYKIIDAESDMGTILKLPYNVDVSDSYSPDVALVEYIGRSHPVSYYGTQLGVTASWSAVITADDIESLRLLRELAIYRGDAYVREPSGVGYWAQVTPSFSLAHMSLVIPVTLSITRVEGRS